MMGRGVAAAGWLVLVLGGFVDSPSVVTALEAAVNRARAPKA